MKATRRVSKRKDGEPVTRSMLDIAMRDLGLTETPGPQATARITAVRRAG